MFKKLEEKIVKSTDVLTRMFREMEPCPSDRKLSPRRLQLLRGAIEDGSFRTCEWASAYCAETGKEYRVNGKHTSHLFGEMNGELPKDQRVLVSKFHCETLEDVARLYSTFDSRISARSTNDINRVFASSHAELAVLPVKTVSTAVTGLSYNLWEDGYGAHPADERAELMLKHADFVLWLHDTFTGGEEIKSSRHLQRGPVAAAMAKTFHKAQGASSEFWSLVRDGSSPKHKSPDRKIRDYLLATTVNTGRGAGSRGKGHAIPREIFVKCLHAWNAWRRGEDTDLKFFPNAKTPACV